MASGNSTIGSLARDAIDGTILGHQESIRRLTHAGAASTLAHAWIFHGPSGIGKCTIAMRLAALLTEPTTTNDEWLHFSPRRDGNTAKLLRLGTHPDVRVIHKELAATSRDATLRDRKQLNIPVGLLREHMIGGVDSEGRVMDAPAFRTSWCGGGKVFIIDEAELLDAEGQNALLKTLEEPPPQTWFFLIASHADRLLPTTRSRCQSLSFAPLTQDEMKTWSKARLADANPTERDWAIPYSGGSPGQALTALNEGLHGWWIKLDPMWSALAKGHWPSGAAETMAVLIGEYAERAVKRDARASKEAANRRGLEIILHMLSERVRREMHSQSATATDAQPREDLERWTRVIDVIAEVESVVSANVNLKHALTYLVSEWQEALSTESVDA
ncbi:MAG: hypothetical protein O2800_01170 [Planctomycetota bacterium]|nr:hypothetical protein [Planctomycetota bacterium]